MNEYSTAIAQAINQGVDIMGSYYSIGVITELNATSKKSLSEKGWKEILKKRIDPEIFDLTVEESKIIGKLKGEVFTGNISELFQILREACGPHYNYCLNDYEKEWGTAYENYPTGYERLYVQDLEGNTISLEVSFALLLLEGKVLAEKFNTDPPLINWLFRNSAIKNKLAGCMISSIV